MVVDNGASDLELPTAGFQAANILQDGAPEAYHKWMKIPGEKPI